VTRGGNPFAPILLPVRDVYSGAGPDGRCLTGERSGAKRCNDIVFFVHCTMAAGNKIYVIRQEFAKYQ
jgi:hypothetical protein